VTLVGDEPVPPYQRPALSKALLSGACSGDDLHLRLPGWFDDHGIDLRLGCRVDRIDRRTALVRGRELTWEHLVIATGARPRVLPLLRPAAPHYLRTLDDARALRGRLGPGVRLAVVGAGLVGAEVASTARNLGCEVTVVDEAAGPVAGIVGRAPSALLFERWRRAGVVGRFESTVASVTRDELQLTDGARIRFDVLLAAVGAEPHAGLIRPRGAIVTDTCGRTGLRNVFACGDVARFGGRSGGHWAAAAGQAAAVASAILGEPQPYVEPGYFWSDQFGVRLQMIGGGPPAATALEIEGDDESFAVRYFDAAGRTVGVLLVNRSAEIGAVRRELAAAA
jgi:3-phenylpropionate/trans-cinnamate dioxygenase ferredoxin reductase subunit